MYTGAIVLTDGFQGGPAAVSSLRMASGDVLDSIFPDVKFGVGGVLFNIRVSSSGTLGLYDRSFDSVSPVFVNF